MPERYPARINLRLTQETYDAYEEAAELIGTDTTSLVRQFVDANVQTLTTTIQAAKEMQAGRPAAGAGLFVTLVDMVMKQGELAQKSASALQHEMQDFESVRNQKSEPTV